MAEIIQPTDEEIQRNIKKWDIPMPQQDYMVVVQCSTYNHEEYIEDALKGFVMQNTDFPFCVLVTDDCSTDGTADVIKKYAVKYPTIIIPILLGENHMQHKKSRDPYIGPWHNRAKYLAICEGDDYWIDPLKLQKQVDLMESRPDYSQCFTAHCCEYPDGKRIEEHRYSNNVVDCSIKDAILMGGGYMASPSVMYKKELRDNLPDWYKNLPVGDLPTMLVLFERGKCGYINDVTAVYRVSAKSSWSNTMKADYSKKMHLYSSIKKMWKDYDVWTNKKYHKWVRIKIMRNNISMLHDKLRHFIKKK